MEPEATFVVLYAAAMLAGAAGLHRLGCARHPRRTDRSDDQGPAARTERPVTSDRDPSWPHSEVQRFYTGMALVAASASTLLSAGELLGRDHRLAETSVLVTVIVLGLVTVGWLGEKFARRWGVLAGELVAWIAEARLRERRRGG